MKAQGNFLNIKTALLKLPGSWKELMKILEEKSKKQIAHKGKTINTFRR